MPRPKKKSVTEEFLPVHSTPVVIIPRVFTVPDAARYLSATNWFVEELLRSGEVRSFIQGKKRVVDVRELDKYVDRRNAEPLTKLEERIANLDKAA
jgi:excisionase family DNA binding protein